MYAFIHLKKYVYTYIRTYINLFTSKSNILETFQIMFAYSYSTDISFKQ